MTSNQTENQFIIDSNHPNSSNELIKDLDKEQDGKEMAKTLLQSPSLSEFNLSRIKEERVISHAQETVESLKRQLDLKGEMVAKYRLMLKTSRQEFLEKLEIKECQIKELQEKIHLVSLKEIERFQSKSLIFDSQMYLLDKEENQREEELKVENEIIMNLQKMNELKDEKIKRNEEELKKIDFKIKGFHEEIKALHEEKEKEIKEIQEGNWIEVERLTRELNGLKEENLDLVEKSNELNQQIENEKELLILNNQFHDENEMKLKGELELKSKKIKNLKNEIQEWKVKVSSFSGELEHLKSTQNNFSCDEIVIQDQMAMKIGRLDVKNKRLLDEKKVISKENEELKKELDQAKHHLMERNDELVVLKKTIEMYKSPNSSGKPIEQLINQLLSTCSPKQRGNTSLWNLEKKEQKKMELLREKLKEQIFKVEELSSYNIQLKENLTRNEKDRLRIMNELQSIKAKSSTPALQEAHINEINKLNGKVQTLQAALIKASDHVKTTQARDVVNHDHLTLFDKKYEHLQKEYLDLQKKVQDMTLELEKEQKTATAHITKLSDENQKLRSRLKKEGEKSDSIVKQLLSLSVEIDGYKNEISLLKGTVRAYSRESISEDKNETIRNLKKELEEKDRTLYELMATEGSAGKVVSENRKLRREMEVMEMRVEKLSHLPKNLQSA